jgi:hypothetical protein
MAEELQGYHDPSMCYLVYTVRPIVTCNSVEAMNSPIGPMTIKGGCSLHTYVIRYLMSLEGSRADHPIMKSMF